MVAAVGLILEKRIIQTICSTERGAGQIAFFLAMNLETQSRISFKKDKLEASLCDAGSTSSVLFRGLEAGTQGP